MLNLAPITSAATLKLVIYRLLERDDGLSDTELAFELGISAPSLWRAKNAVATLDLSPPEPEAIEEEESSSLERDAELIDAITPDGKVGQHRTGADVRRRKLRLFIQQVWRENVPNGEKFTAAQVDDLAKVAEQNTHMSPAALILDRINTFALLHADRVTATQYRYIRKMILNYSPDDRPPAPTWQKKPAAGAPAPTYKPRAQWTGGNEGGLSDEELKLEQAKRSQAWTDKHRPKGPMVMKFAIDEEEEE